MARILSVMALLAAVAVAAADSPPSSDLVTTILGNMAAQEARYVAELMEFVAIPSVSAVPDHQPDILRAAEWVAARLRAAGFNAVRLLENPAGPRPAVFGERIVSKNLPTALLYGHYDVQPADPVVAWTSPPFDPVVRDGALFGRGASDDKGCLLGPLQALEAWINATDGALPVNIKVIVEGEEEIGSPYLEPFLETYKDTLAADFVLSADGSQISDTQPSITLGLRGAAALEVRVTALARDVHSGSYGGAVQNPARALAHLLSSMFDPVTNRVLVKGFYDRVVPATDADRADMAAAVAGGDGDALAAEVGALGAVGEEGYSTLERVWLRPTLEVVGIGGGYAGAGIKTVLPAEAVAKLAARLVPDQRPEEILAAVQAHIEEHRPPAVNVTVTPLGFKAAPFTTSRDGPVTAAAARVLEAVVGAPPRYVRGGATIPALAAFQKHLGAETTVLAFGLPSDTVHAPDERYNLTQYAVSREAYVRMLAEMGAEVAAGRLAPKAAGAGSSASDRSEL